MTVKELYNMTKARMFEKPTSKIYDNYYIEIINKVLAELFDENNMCRMFHGLSPLEEIPVMTDEDSVIPYEDEYNRYVIPLGVDAYFQIDDDLNKHNIYETKYNNARVMHQKFVSQERIDAISK